MQGTAIQKNGSWIILSEDNQEITPTADTDFSVLYDNCFITYEMMDDGTGAITAHRPQNLNN